MKKIKKNLDHVTKSWWIRAASKFIIGRVGFVRYYDGNVNVNYCNNHDSGFAPICII